MVETKRTPAWARRPWGGCVCRICGEHIRADENYEAVRPKGGPTRFFHTDCIKKERAK